jgi:carboxypeptidase PM20D1
MEITFLNIVIVLVVLLLFLLAFMLFRSLRYARPLEPVAMVEAIEVDAEKVVQNLAGALRFPTISVVDKKVSGYIPFLDQQRYLEQTYPLVHSRLQRRRIMDYALLYSWTGSNSNLEPVVLMAHQDVVPVEEETLSEWEHPPFDGVVADEFIWGRGALDMKSHMIAILEAVEHLLAEGFKPERTVYLAFGHDEEIGGHGAREIANFLNDQGIHPAAVLDEGGSLVEGILPGIKEPVGLVGIAEKGYVTLQLTAEATPGHSATPPRETAIGILAKALAFVEAAPQPTSLASAQMLFRGLGPVLPFTLQFALANLWLFGGLVRRNLEKSPPTYAMIHTTSAPTIFKAGVKENVLPASATAMVNFRLMPGDTIATVCERVRKIIDDDRVKFEPMQNFISEPSTFSSTDSPQYQALTRTIREMFDGVVVAPMLVLGGTDARNYHPLCDNVYRFSPMTLNTEDRKRVHGNNERIAVDEMALMVQFFARLIQVWAGPEETD